MGVPKMDGFQWTIPLKWMIWGYPDFMPCFLHTSRTSSHCFLHGDVYIVPQCGAPNELAKLANITSLWYMILTTSYNILEHLITSYNIL